MKMDTSEVRSTLNDLIETCKDGEQGFRGSAEKLTDTNVRSQFLKFAQRRAQFAGELQAEVTRMGSEPAKSGTAGGAMHRGWTDLKSALGAGDHMILEEAERGEDAAVKSYRDALSKHMPNDINSIVERQYREIQQTHNTVRAIRDRGHTMVGKP